jgi:dihydrofolate reductase
MGRVVVDISMSLDGFVAGPNQGLEAPLGEGGESLHEWIFGLKAWHDMQGLEDGSTGPDNDIVVERIASTGATVMGRHMFGGGDGPWDESWKGWWGDEPPYHHQVFVLTHHPREPLEMQGGTTFNFVTDGIESAVDQARAAAGDKNVLVAGGAEAIQQALRAGLVDELRLHVVPLLLGSGARLLDGLDATSLELQKTRVVDSELVTHLEFRVVR